MHKGNGFKILRINEVSYTIIMHLMLVGKIEAYFFCLFFLQYFLNRKVYSLSKFAINGTVYEKINLHITLTNCHWVGCFGFFCKTVNSTSFLFINKVDLHKILYRKVPLHFCVKCRNFRENLLKRLAYIRIKLEQELVYFRYLCETATLCLTFDC